MLATMKALWSGRRGQGMTEYALILVFVVAVAAAALLTDNSQGLGLAISNAFARVTAAI